MPFANGRGGRRQRVGELGAKIIRLAAQPGGERGNAAHAGDAVDLLRPGRQALELPPDRAAGALERVELRLP